MSSTAPGVIDGDGHVVEPGWLFGPWLADGELPMELPPTTPMVPCGDFALVEDQLRSGFDGPSYLRAMDALGVDIAVVYPSIGLYVPFLPSMTAHQSADACRAYNDWVADLCAADSRRLRAAALVPLIDPLLAAAEVDRIASLGLVAVVGRPNRLYGRNLGSADYDPVYEALAATGLVLAVHEGLGLPGPPGTTTGRHRFDTFAAQHACSHPLEQQQALLSLCFEGALERHPELRVAFLESGTGWLPWWLDRLDEHAEWMGPTELSDLSARPSEYFARQCVISSEADDHLVAHAIAAVGADHVMWASDFPHPDAVFPGAVEEFRTRLEATGVGDAAIDQVLRGTPAGLYRL